MIDSFNYTLDANGNRVGVTSNDGTESYSLDALNRITAASYPNGTSEAFAYDAAGNRTSHTKTDGSTVTYSHDAAGQIVSDSDGTSYSYDAAGNLTGTSAGDAYSYDPWGHLTSTTIDGVTTTASFDATGVRVAVDGDSQLWDRTGYGTLISTGTGDNYVHNPGGGILRDNDSWLHGDAVGSVRYSTDPTGAVNGAAAFTVFGEPRITGNSQFGFAGEQTDPTGLLHLRARGYNPTLGTFTAYDPIQPGGPSTAGWNHYTYTANNPTSWSDPTGMSAFAENKLLLAVGAFALAGAVLLAIAPQDIEDLPSIGGDGARSDSPTDTHDQINDAVDGTTGVGAGSTGVGTGATQAEIDAAFWAIVNPLIQPNAEPEPGPTPVPPAIDNFGHDCDSLPKFDDEDELRRVSQEANQAWSGTPIQRQTVAALSICIDSPVGPISAGVIAGQPPLEDGQAPQFGRFVSAPELETYAHAEEKVITLARAIPGARLDAIYSTNSFCARCEALVQAAGATIVNPNYALWESP